MSNNRGKYRYLFKNIGFLTLSSFASRLLSFFLIPLYTNILSTADYGKYELVSTTIAILIPVLTINIQEGIMRFTMEKKYHNGDILSTGVKYLCFSTAVVTAALFLNYAFSLFDVIKVYTVYFWLMFVLQTVSEMLSSYIRGNDRIADISIAGVVSTAVFLLFNILFLVVFGWGLDGYFLSAIFSSLSYNGLLALKARRLLLVRSSSKKQKTASEMAEYCKPTVLNAVAWWVNSASDRYIVTYFLGVSENGIYAVASKIPGILNIVQSIFAQAWSLSAVKEYDKEDSQGFFSKTYNTYNCALTVGCALLIAFDRLLARIIYAKDFFAAWRYVPWLTMAILFGALSGCLGGVFLAVKDSKLYARSSVVGAVSNIILNLILMPLIGAMGAAIATTFTYFVVWCFRIVQVRRHIKLKIHFTRDILSYFFLLVQTVILLCISGVFLYLLQAIFVICIASLYRKEIKDVLNYALSFLKKDEVAL